MPLKVNRAKNGGLSRFRPGGAAVPKSVHSGRGSQIRQKRSEG